MHILTDFEMEAEMMHYGPDEDLYDNDTRTCTTCGGEFWDGGTSCICIEWPKEPITKFERHVHLLTKIHHRRPLNYHRFNKYKPKSITINDADNLPF